MGDEDFYIDGVPEFIAQLLDKLVNNAVDFAEPHSPISVSYTVSDNQATFTIFNHGPQLPDAMGKHIFDSMVSVRETSKQQEPHLGLGLYMARLICDFHNASIVAINRTNGVAVEVKFSRGA